MYSGGSNGKAATLYNVKIASFCKGTPAIDFEKRLSSPIFRQFLRDFIKSCGGGGAFM